MANWMQQLKETYSHMVHSRLLREGGSLNVGTPGQMGEPMQPAMRPMRPGDDPHQRLAAGREQLAKDWQEQEYSENKAILQQAGAMLAPVIALAPAVASSALGPLGVSPSVAETMPYAFAAGLPAALSLYDETAALRSGKLPYTYSEGNPFVHQYVDLNGQSKTSQATPAKPTPKSNEQYKAPYQNPNPYGDWDPNKPSNR